MFEDLDSLEKLATKYFK